MLPTAQELFLNSSQGLPDRSASQDLLEERFFYSIELSNGTHKRTWAGRLDDVDQALLAVFRKFDVTPKTFLDVAVSSGVSTVSWCDALRQAGLRPSMTATDLTMTAYLIRLRDWLHVLVDKDGFPLQYDVCGYAWRPRCRIRCYPLGNGALTVLWDVLYRETARKHDLLARLKSLGLTTPAVGDPLIKAEIKLVTRRLRDNPDIELLDDDILAPTPAHLQRRFEVIRAANILNRGYFSKEQLRSAVTHLRERLLGDGSFFLVVRTDETATNNGTLFLAEGGRNIQGSSNVSVRGLR
jgi:hypothetical protein